MKYNVILNHSELDSLIIELSKKYIFCSDFSFIKEENLYFHGWIDFEDDYINPLFVYSKNLYIQESKKYPDNSMFAKIRKYVKSQKYKGIMDSYKKVILDPNYTEIKFTGLNDFFIIVRNEKYGLFSVSRGIICNPCFDKILNPTEAVFPVIANNKLGYMDVAGKQIIPTEYEYDENAVPSFKDGIVEVEMELENHTLYRKIDHYNNVIYEEKRRKNRSLDYDNNYYTGEIVDYDILDAYEGDESNMWNTD